MGKVSSVNGWDSWPVTGKAMKPDHYLTQHTTINLKWMKDSNIRPETIQFTENNRGCHLPDIGLSHGFAEFSIGNGDKSKNTQTGLYFTTELLHSEGNNPQNKKATYSMGKDICLS